jgi:predicted transcriptional regulator
MFIISIIVLYCMLLPSEVESKLIIPVLRSILAKKLSTQYALEEKIIANILGITQPAISNYIRGIRGDKNFMSKVLDIDELTSKINRVARDLATSKAQTPLSMSMLIELCDFIRNSLLICEAHHLMESDINEEICEQCRVILKTSK